MISSIPVSCRVETFTPRQMPIFSLNDEGAAQAGSLSNRGTLERQFAAALDMPILDEIGHLVFLAETIGFETVDHRGREAVVDLRHVDVLRTEAGAAPACSHELVDRCGPWSIRRRCRRASRRRSSSGFVNIQQIVPDFVMSQYYTALGSTVRKDRIRLKKDNSIS